MNERILQGFGCAIAVLMIFAAILGSAVLAGIWFAIFLDVAGLSA